MQPATVDFLRLSGIVEDVAGENEETFINYYDGVQTQRVFAVQATKNYFSALGVPLAQGRGWTESDPDEVAVVSARFRHSRLGGETAIVGRVIRLDGRPSTVLGVLPIALGRVADFSMIRPTSSPPRSRAFSNFIPPEFNQLQI